MVVVDNDPTESMYSIVMADDGLGGSISIPSFLIGYDDGQKLIEEIHREIANDLYDAIE